jgi:hypothetical protein
LLDEPQQNKNIFKQSNKTENHRMPRRVIWRSWSKPEAEFELTRIKSLPLKNTWLDGHKVAPKQGDIYLTTNGYDHKKGPFFTVSWYAESYVYLPLEYDKWVPNQVKWDHRFHFNPLYYNTPKCSEIGIHTWWKQEIALFEQLRKNKEIKYTFGMVLGRKKGKLKPCDHGWLRSEIVKAGQGRSFKYYGTDWPKGDPNYGGQAYIDGHRGSPLKFHDARRLMQHAKFVFAIENTHDDKYSLNYVTEKIWHGFLSCSIPIYLGCGNIEKVIPPDIFIDMREFKNKPSAVMDYCEQMPEHEYKGYLDRIDEFLHGPGQKFTCEQRFLDIDQKLTELFPDSKQPPIQPRRPILKRQIKGIGCRKCRIQKPR